MPPKIKLKIPPDPHFYIPSPSDVQQAAQSLREALDPPLLTQRARLFLDDWQKEVLRAKPKRGIVLASRQSGKSTVAAAAVLHEAIYNPGCTSLVVAPAERQSKEFLVRLRTLLSALGQGAPEVQSEAQMYLLLQNGSRIIATPGSEQTLRGFTVNGICVLDESSRIEETTYEAVRPMLAVGGGRLLCISTPNGSTGWFADAWHSKEDAGWERWKVTALDCPRITPEFLAFERASLSDATFRQEYLCEFVDDSSSVFDAAAIRRAFNQEEEDDELQAIYIPPYQGRIHT